MTKKDKKGFTVNYNGEEIKPGEVMIPFEYTEGDAENCTNPECIKTVRQGGRCFKVIYKAVPEEWAKEGKAAFNLFQNEVLGHYDVPNSVSMDEVADDYGLELGKAPSAEEVFERKDSLEDNIRIFREKVTLLIEKAPKIGYAVLLMFNGSKGVEFSEKLRLKHDGANKVRRVADHILVEGLMNTDLSSISCKRNNYTEVYREEALALLDDVISRL